MGIQHYTKGQGSNSDLSRYKGAFGTAELVHLLKRTMFGASKKDIDYFSKKELTGIVDALLDSSEQLPSPPLNDYDELAIHGVPWGSTWIHAPYVLADDQPRLISFWKWTIGTFIQQGRTLREKMTLFLHNHFATVADMNRTDMVWKHHHLLRTNALGNFKALAKAITLDAHMLRFLNGEENTSKAPNENYARELQELFCTGKGPGSKYTEEDVKQAAKVLTGWKVDYKTGEVFFVPADHDVSNKQFSSFYDHKIIEGKQGDKGGEQELDELLDLIFSNPETALFICRKIYRWFVFSSIDEQTEIDVIQPMAAIFRKNNYELKPVLAALFGSNHFFDTTNFGAQIKSPIDFCVGLLREFEVKHVPEERFSLNYSMWYFLVEWCGKMGQLYAYPPNVSGWPAYYQAPTYYQLWLNGATYPRRNEFSAIMIDFGFNQGGHFFIADVIHFAKSLKDPGDPNLLISESLEMLYRVPVSRESMNTLKKNILLSGQEQDHYWTDAWNDHLNDPSDMTLKNVVENRLKNLYRYIVNSPEYQLA